MTEVVIGESDIQEGKRKADELRELKNSIRKGEGNVYGFLGEIIVAKTIAAVITNTYDYDLVKGSWTIDVKTKACTSIPRPDYECSVAAFNTKQQCDFYIFVRILEDFSRGWILGKKRKEEYFREARFCKEGEVDPLSNLGWKFKADCYNLAIGSLQPVLGRSI